VKNLPIGAGDMKSCEVIALFGNARLVRWADGTFQIQGGSEADRKDAAEWTGRCMDVRLAVWDLIRR
jgi:hypothetical protein